MGYLDIFKKTKDKVEQKAYQPKKYEIYGQYVKRRKKTKEPVDKKKLKND